MCTEYAERAGDTWADEDAKGLWRLDGSGRVIGMLGRLTGTGAALVGARLCCDHEVVGWYIAGMGIGRPVGSGRWLERHVSGGLVLEWI